MPAMVLLMRVPSVTAAIVAGALEAEGIDVVLDRPGFGAIYGLDSGPHATALMVPEDQVDRARDLIRSIEADVG